MNKILEIDQDLKKVRIEAGVTWGNWPVNWQSKACAHRCLLLPPANRSVLSDFLDREVPPIPFTITVNRCRDSKLSGRQASLPIRLRQRQWISGFRIPRRKSFGPRHRLLSILQGAQGTMGVVTWTNLKVMFQTKKDKVFFVPVDDLPLCAGIPLQDSAAQSWTGSSSSQRTDLATIVADNFPKDFERLRATLPPGL